MKKRDVVTSLFISCVLLGALPSLGVAIPSGPPIIINPGTTEIVIDNQAFLVSTDRTISLVLDFVGIDLLEGAISVSGGQSAVVQIVWRDPDLTIYSGTVVQVAPIRYRMPAPYQAQQDSGHTEK